MTTWNQCHNVTDLSVDDGILCNGCCIPSTKEFQVDEDVVIIKHSLVKAGATAGKVLPWAVGDDILGIAKCGVDSTTGCDEDVCVILRDALIKSSMIVWPAGTTAQQKADAILELEALRIFTAVTVGNCNLT